MLITIAYRITRKLLGALATIARRDERAKHGLLFRFVLAFVIGRALTWFVSARPARVDRHAFRM